MVRAGKETTFLLQNDYQQITKHRQALGLSCVRSRETILAPYNMNPNARNCPARLVPIAKNWFAGRVAGRLWRLSVVLGADYFDFSYHGYGFNK